MTFEKSEVFILYDKQNKEYNRKLLKQSDFNKIISSIIESKFDSLKDRCKASDESIPRLDTIQNSFDEVVENNMKCCYCGITMIYYINESKNKIQQQNDEKYKFIASIEHKTPLSKGGNNTKQNIGFSCLICNQVKNNMLEEDFKQLISKISYEDLFNLYETIFNLNKIIGNKITETKYTKKENNELQKTINKLNFKYNDDVYKKDNTIKQLKSNLGDIKSENKFLLKEITNYDLKKIDDGETLNILKDNLIIKQKEQIKYFKCLYESEVRIRYLELKIMKANGKENNCNIVKW
jgi:5-methylcytosine-specific restriction endonuclease McrA